MTTFNNLLRGDQLGVVFHQFCHLDDEMLCWVETFWYKMVPEFLRVMLWKMYAPIIREAIPRQFFGMSRKTLTLRILILRKWFEPRSSIAYLD